jgi:hypothetical protein
MQTKPAVATRHVATYPGCPDQVRHVRHAVARYLAGCPAADEAVLVVSELAANAVVHSASRGAFFTVRAELPRITCGSRPKISAALGTAGHPTAARTAWT